MGKLPGGPAAGLKIELPVFVPCPWVVDGASPERRFTRRQHSRGTFTPGEESFVVRSDADP